MSIDPRVLGAHQPPRASLSKLVTTLYHTAPLKLAYQHIIKNTITVTGLLREEAGGLWTSVAAERKRFRQNVVWQSYSARRELCHGAIKKFHVLKPPKVVVAVHFAM